MWREEKKKKKKVFLHSFIPRYTDIDVYIYTFLRHRVFFLACT